MKYKPMTKQGPNTMLHNGIFRLYIKSYFSSCKCVPVLSLNFIFSTAVMSLAFIVSSTSYFKAGLH